LIDYRKIFEDQIKTLSQQSRCTITAYEVRFLETPMFSASNIEFWKKLPSFASMVNKVLNSTKEGVEAFVQCAIT